MSSILDDLKFQYHIGGVVNKLIYWNIGLFVVPYVVAAILSLFTIEIDFIQYVSLSSNPVELLWKPWSIITYAFFHAGIFHILFNLLVLNFASRLFLTFFSQKQLLALYFTGAIFAGLIYILSYFAFPALAHLKVSLVGASASIMAILFAAVAYAPMMEVRLLLIGNVKLWHIAAFLIVMDLIQLPLENTGGHLSHLGGAMFGYLYIKQLQNGTDLGLWFTKTIDFFATMTGKRKANPFKKVHKNYNPSTVKPVSKIITKDKTQQQIDDILDKISQSGYDSLTKEEKEFLFKMGK